MTMKQTAVQWLYDQINDMFPLEYANELEGHFAKAEQMEKQEQDKIYDHAFKYGQLSTPEQTKASVEKVKEYQNWLRKIPELSDEEIRKAIHKYNITDFGQVAAFQVGAKWYREQLKQIQ